LAVPGEHDIDNAAFTAECHHQVAWRLARQDVTTSVTFELEIPALTQITAKRGKPAAYSVRISNGLPDVYCLGWIATLQPHRDKLAALGMLLFDLSGRGADLLGNVDDH
jgi:hypothetical protein